MEIRREDARDCDGAPRHRLRVYITTECFSCEEAVLIAAEITQKFPQIVTEIVNLQDPCASKPDNVFAVPTYLLDGKVLSLGNPYREHLFARIADVLSADLVLGA